MDERTTEARVGRSADRRDGRKTHHERIGLAESRADRRAETTAPTSTEISRDPQNTPDGNVENGSGGGFADHLASVAEPVASLVEPIVDHWVMPFAGAIGNVLEAASGAFGVRDVINERLLHRAPPEPLPNLYDLHPEARDASPRELGFRFVPIEDIRGTAVAGAAQRGEDFLPLPPFRGSNWEARWQRIREANKQLQPLPPIDVIKYDGEFWVVDGHNRVAATRASRGVGLDSMVVELVPLDGQVSERPSGVLSFIGDSGALRAAAQGRRPAVGTQVSVPTAQGPSGAGRKNTGQQRDRDGNGRNRRVDRDGSPAGPEADAG
jgi:hypothetical protein